MAGSHHQCDALVYHSQQRCYRRSLSLPSLHLCMAHPWLRSDKAEQTRHASTCRRFVTAGKPLLLLSAHRDTQLILSSI